MLLFFLSMLTFERKKIWDMEFNYEITLWNKRITKCKLFSHDSLFSSFSLLYCVDMIPLIQTICDDVKQALFAFVYILSFSPTDSVKTKPTLESVETKTTAIEKYSHRTHIQLILDVSQWLLWSDWILIWFRKFNH